MSGNSGFRVNPKNSASDSSWQTVSGSDADSSAAGINWNLANSQSEPLPYHPQGLVPERAQTQSNPDTAGNQQKYAIYENNNDLPAQLEPEPKKKITCPKTIIEPSPNPSLLRIYPNPDLTLFSSRHCQGSIFQSFVLPKRTERMNKVNTKSYTIVGSEQHLESSQQLLGQQPVGQIGHSRELIVSPSLSTNDHNGDDCLGSATSSLVQAYEEQLSAKTALIASQAKQLKRMKKKYEKLCKSIKEFETGSEPLEYPENARIQNSESNPDNFDDEPASNLPGSECQDQALPVLRKHSSMIIYLKGIHRQRNQEKKDQRNQATLPLPSCDFEYPLEEKLQEAVTVYNSSGNSELSTQVAALRTALAARQSLLNELRNRIQKAHILFNKKHGRIATQPNVSVPQLQHIIKTHQTFVRWLNKFTLDGVHLIQDFEKTYLFNHRKKIRYSYEGFMSIGDKDQDGDGDDNLDREETVRGIFIPLDLHAYPGLKLSSHDEKSNVATSTLDLILQLDKETLTNGQAKDTSTTALSYAHVDKNYKVASESGLVTPAKKLVQDELTLASESVCRIRQTMTAPKFDLNKVVRQTSTSRNCAFNFFNQQTQATGKTYYDSSDRSLATEELYRRPKTLDESTNMFPIEAFQQTEEVLTQPEVQLDIPLVSVEIMYKKLDNLREIVRQFSKESLDILRNGVVKQESVTTESEDGTSASSIEDEYDSLEVFPVICRSAPAPTLEPYPEDDDHDASPTFQSLSDDNCYTTRDKNTS